MDGAPESDMLFEVMDADVTRLSPGRRFLVVGRMSGYRAQLWFGEKSTCRYGHSGKMVTTESVC